MSYFSEVCKLPESVFEGWLREVIDDGIGYLKVSNTGGSWLIYDRGTFHQKHMGVTKELYRTKRAAKEMFRKAKLKFQNVEYSGYRYYYDRGNWKKVKTTFQYD